MTELLLGAALLVSAPGSPALSPPVAATPAFTLTLPDTATVARWGREGAPRIQTSTPKRHNMTDRVLAVAAGVALGWVIGAGVGYYVTQDRDVYDDGTSGLKGAFIGAPIGATAGGLLGWRLTRN